MDKNSPANAEDVGSIPASGRLPSRRATKVCVPQLLSPHAAAAEIVCLEPVLHSKRTHCNK